MDGTTPDYTTDEQEREAALALQINQAIGGQQVDVILNAMTRVMSAVLASVRLNTSAGGIKARRRVARGSPRA